MSTSTDTSRSALVPQQQLRLPVSLLAGLSNPEAFESRCAMVPAC